INEALDLEVVLQGVLDSARSLTDARYGAITTLGDAGQMEDLLISGLTPEETQRLREMPDGQRIFEYVSSLPEPLRVADFADYAKSIGLPAFRPPVPVSSVLAAPIRHHGVGVGNIYLTKSEPGLTFTREDEETLVMFVSQAALVIGNARRHRDERRARADLETLINISPVGVVVFDAKTGAPVSFNREAERIVDGLREPDQPLEQLLDVLSYVRADGREISLKERPLTELLRTGEVIRVEEIVIRLPGGRSVSTLLNATPIRSDRGGVESYVITLQDMTPLEETERLRAEFLAMVSHELRTPLTSIKGSATTVLDSAAELDPAELRQFQRIIVEQADNMRDLIGDLLDVARIETGALSISPEPTEAAVLVDRAKNTFLSGGNRSALDINLAADLPLVMADRRRIVQVIGNLLANAARHSPGATPIRVSAVREAMHVVFSVTDEGRGIPAERLPHLFRKFSRIESEDQGGDTGLGLAICKGIVEAHGGRIWADSEGPGLGARFSFTIPAAQDAPIPDPLPAARPDAEASQGQRVLVVDDDPQTLGYVRKALTDAGYAPIVAAEADEALHLIQESEPELVLLDMMLPGADGIELMSDIAGIAELPVVFLSAYRHDVTIARALEKGAVDYIVKPFSPTELVARVRAALRKWHAPARSAPSEPYVRGDLTIDYAERRVRVAGRSVQLTATEYRLLFELSVNAGRVVEHRQLLRRRGSTAMPRDVRSLRTHVRRIRQKLGDDASAPTYIFAEPRVGYRMAVSETRVAAE
ncbi:MAG: ATP-binding protein, partial [Gemmatimonadota bacterium]|nr:ATP-binding protein [Gemmatimonadota bacterium]